jgi:hypothetical protein
LSDDVGLLEDHRDPVAADLAHGVGPGSSAGPSRRR